MQAWVQLLTARSALKDVRRGPRRHRRREAGVGAAAHGQERFEGRATWSTPSPTQGSRRGCSCSRPGALLEDVRRGPRRHRRREAGVGAAAHGQERFWRTCDVVHAVTDAGKQSLGQLFSNTSKLHVQWYKMSLNYLLHRLFFMCRLFFH
jgi:hypothetical protein